MARGLWPIGLAAALGWGHASCALRLPGDGPEQELGIPCAAAMECPQPDEPCLLAYCMEGQCVHVPAPEGQLPEDHQQDGDCQLMYCDGNGQVASYPAQHDRPADDGNPCTEQICKAYKPAQRPKAAGVSCGDEGLCNGAGTCGVCLPKKAECEAHGVRSCQADGQWGPTKPCAPAQPVCNQARCVGLSQVAIGARHGCAAFGDGSVRCWGAADRGQLGTGGLTAAGPAPWGAGFVSPALGRRHGCALDGSGAVWCWGAGDLGQLGQGSFESAAGPVQAGVPAATAVAVGHGHSCALSAAGAVHCWGRNDRGQIGSGKAPREPLSTAGSRPRGSGRPQPQPIEGLSGVTALRSDETTSCVRIGAQPTLRCWGLPSFELPPAVDEPDEVKRLEAATASTPTGVPDLPAAQQLAAGEHFSCALGRDGSAHCWGANDAGQLGDGSKTDRFKPVPVAGLSSAERLVLGDAFGCALLAGGSVRCWGANDRGQLGTGQPGGAARPQPVPGLTDVKQLYAGSHFACALRRDGALLCWGAGQSGQLGNGATADAPRPVAVIW